MKIAILGYAGSGKTYISDYISKKKNLPVLHLDSIKWDKEWKPIDDSLVLPQVSEFMAKDDWIVDGYYNYLYFDERLEQANLIVLLLLPRLTCFYRAVKRTKSHRQDGYKNDLNWWFVKFTLFGCRNKERRQTYVEIAEKYKDKTVVIKTRRQVDEFMKNITDKQITIEPLNPDDYHKCSNIWNMKSQPLADKWLDEIKSGNRLVFIYKINGEFIGEGALVLDEGDPDYTISNKRIYVSRMIVKKEYRNRGIGSEILAFLIEKAKEMGFEEMTIGVDKDNVNALHLYKKYGFTEVLFDGADENGEYYKLMKRIQKCVY